VNDQPVYALFLIHQKGGMKTDVSLAFYLSLNSFLNVSFSSGPSSFCFGLLTLPYRRITHHEICVAKLYLVVALVHRILKITCELNIVQDALGNHHRRTFSWFCMHFGDIWVGRECVGEPFPTLHLRAAGILFTRPSRLLPRFRARAILS
jgi:hypothetical protein